MKKLSEQNRVRVRKIIAPRGVMFDRNGAVLADTRPAFNLYITPEDIRDFNETVDGTAKLLNLDREEIVEKLKLAVGFPPSFPVKIKPDISMDELARIEANRIYLPGTSVQIEPKRNYPFGTMASHVLGYVSEINEEELKNKDYDDYSPGDYIGKYGLEKQYEEYLRGTDGEKRVEVDAMGREVRVLDVKEPIAGNNLYLNIDMNLQAPVEKALEGKSGGCIALDPRTGSVLVLISKPSFDPNIFASGITRQDWLKLVQDKKHPLQNKVIQGRYPPGSTFKIVLSTKALEDNILNEKATFFCRGGFPFGKRVFACWQKKGHGTVDMQRAIVESCDVYFYNLGLKLGIDRIHDMATAIGLGKITGIDLPGEKDGVVPSPAWKQKVFGQPWYEGETVSVAIGQGAVWLTPIQLAQLAGFVANEGTTYRPQIVNKIVSPDGRIIKTFEPRINGRKTLKKTTIRVVKEGMKGVVNSPRGTAYGSRSQNVSISGKTGTAQAGSMDKGKHLGDHAWFIAYAPSDTPTLAMSILVEFGGHGSSTSAPIAKLIAETFHNETTSTKERKINEVR